MGNEKRQGTVHFVIEFTKGEVTGAYITHGPDVIYRHSGRELDKIYAASRDPETFAYTVLRRDLLEHMASPNGHFLVPVDEFRQILEDAEKRTAATYDGNAIQLL